MGNLCHVLKRCGVCRDLVKDGEIMMRDVIFDVGGAIENVFFGSSEGENITPIKIERSNNFKPTIRSNTSQRTIRINMCKKCSFP